MSNGTYRSRAPLTQSVIACVTCVVGNHGQILQILSLCERMDNRFGSTAKTES
jgi:hypothetical protein